MSKIPQPEVTLVDWADFIAAQEQATDGGQVPAVSPRIQHQHAFMLDMLELISTSKARGLGIDYAESAAKETVKIVKRGSL